jgi:hypothetical protein
MPDTRLILHIKGTEAETAELSRESVRTAISQGKITHSQLIWRPAENTWKPVRELPEFLPAERLILHVKGTESETRELPKHAIRVAISQGQITHSQLIWRPEENAWKQVRDLPDLFPSQQVAPTPVRAASPPTVDASEAIIPESPSSPVARVVAAAAQVPQVRVATPQPRVAVGASPDVPQVRVAVATPAIVPQVRAAATPTMAPQVRATATPTVALQVSAAATPAVAPQVRVAATPTVVPQVRVATPPTVTPQVRAATPAPILVRTTGDLKVKDEEESHPLKWLCIGLGIAILLVTGANYLLVDQPLSSSMGQTAFSSAPVYGHLGAFVQPNVVVIHIPNSATVTSQNLTQFLVALARSTPQSPISHDLFARVALTSGWMAQYSFSGYNWNQLAGMAKDSEDQRKEFLMDQMGDAGGQPLVPESTLNQAAQQASRDKVWNDFVAHFTSKS